MDQCQIPGAKLGSDPISPGIRIKEDCRCDFAEAGEKCDIHDKKGSKSILQNLEKGLAKLSFFVDLKRHYRSDLDTTGSNGNPDVTGGSWTNEDMRLGPNPNYTSSSNKDWPFWRPPTLI